jgi:uncharacterized protein involved in exopolysaccharide biosynthesis
VLDSPVVTQLKAQRAQIVQMQTSTNANYGPLHPTARQSNASLADIDAQIASESRKIISALGSAAVSAQARADSLRGRLARSTMSARTRPRPAWKPMHSTARPTPSANSTSS